MPTLRLLTEELFDTQNLCRGEAFVPGFMNQSRIYLHECFALRGVVGGRSIRI